MKASEVQMRDYVFVIEAFSEAIHQYQIVGIEPVSQKAVIPSLYEKSDLYVTLKPVEDRIAGVIKRPVEEIYATYEEAVKVLETKKEEKVQEYKDSIETIEDLVLFLYKNNVSPMEDDIDWNARQAAREKALEFGIYLE